MTDACGNKALTPILDAVAAAEEIADPLDGLVKRVADNPGVPFIPDVLARLCELRREDLPAFEGLRARLKKAGCRVTALDAAMAEESGDGGGRRPRQADILIGLAAEADCFHTADGTGYVDLDIKGHRETSPIRSKGFKRWIARRFYELTDGAPNSEALQAALNVIEARAHFDAPQMDVHIRVAGHDGTLYIDLADDAWRAVEIDEGGWRVVENPPVRFRRATGMQPLPTPAAGGFVEILRPFLNVGDDDFVLVVAWALAVLRNRGPYPVIVLSGEQGSAKSTVSAILRSLLDPNSAPLRALPREERDLFIAAKNSHVLAFDNVSGLQPWISDTLCRLSTGGGFAVRQLYTDQDEVLFDAVRPVILNGIEDIAARPDLADRAIFLTLESIPEERRRPEAELWAAFETERPRILGALLDAVVQGLRMIARHQAGTAAPHGGFRPMGVSLRNRGLVHWHLLVSLLRQPGRSGRERDRGRPSCCRCSCPDGDADKVDGNGDEPFWEPCPTEPGNASPNPRPGRPALGRCPAASVVPRPSCARSALISITARKVGRVPGSFTSRRPEEIPAPQIIGGHNRPHRPHRPRSRRRAMVPTHSRKTTGGRLETLRTVRGTMSARTPPRPSAPTR